MALQRWARHFHLGCQIRGSQLYWKQERRHKPNPRQSVVSLDKRQTLPEVAGFKIDVFFS